MNPPILDSVIGNNTRPLGTAVEGQAIRPRTPSSPSRSSVREDCATPCTRRSTSSCTYLLCDSRKLAASTFDWDVLPCTALLPPECARPDSIARRATASLASFFEGNNASTSKTCNALLTLMLSLLPKCGPGNCISDSVTCSRTRHRGIDSPVDLPIAM